MPGLWSEAEKPAKKRLRFIKLELMSPTVFREKGYRFFFFSREEPRVHIHVYSPDGEAKFWLEPTIELANNYGLSEQQINQVENIIGEREDEIRNAWQKHFPS